MIKFIEAFGARYGAAVGAGEEFVHAAVSNIEVAADFNQANLFRFQQCFIPIRF